MAGSNHLRFPPWLGMVVLLLLLVASVYFSSLKPAEATVVPGRPVATVAPGQSDSLAAGDESRSVFTLGSLDVAVTQTTEKTATSRIERVTVDKVAPVSSLLVMVVDKDVAQSASQIQASQDFEVVADDPIIVFKVNPSNPSLDVVLPSSDGSVVVLLLDPAWGGQTALLKEKAGELSKLTKAGRTTIARFGFALNLKDASNNLAPQANLQNAILELGQSPAASSEDAFDDNSITLFLPADGDFAESYTFSLDELLTDSDKAFFESSTRQIVDARWVDGSELFDYATLSFSEDEVTINVHKSVLALASNGDAKGKIEVLLPAGVPSKRYLSSKTLVVGVEPANIKEIDIPSWGNDELKLSIIDGALDSSTAGITYYRFVVSEGMLEDTSVEETGLSFDAEEGDEEYSPDLALEEFSPSPLELFLENQPRLSISNDGLLWEFLENGGQLDAIVSSTASDAEGSSTASEPIRVTFVSNEDFGGSEEEHSDGVV